MMKRALLMWFVLGLAVCPAVSFAQRSDGQHPRADSSTAALVHEMRAWLISKRHQYENTSTDLAAEDLKKISALSESPALALSVIDELIALAEAREPPPGTTEFFAARSVSPVTRVLAAIGKPAMPKIDQALRQQDLPRWSRLALKDARRIINNERVDFDEVMHSDDILVLPREVREKHSSAIKSRPEQEAGKRGE